MLSLRTRIFSSIAAMLISAAVQADPGTACDLAAGKKYQQSQDYPRAIACYQEGAAKGNGEAYLLLGYMYLEGVGVSKDITKAKELLLQAEAKNVARAVYSLGAMQEKGVGQKPDFPAAVEYYRKAANLGLREAQAALGRLYFSGKVAPNPEEGERFLTLAANAGDLAAQFNLGLLYYNGFKEKTHLGQALIWLERAALHGDRTAPQAVGAMYADGRGVKGDAKRAYTWFLISERVGNPDAKSALAQLQGSLSDAEREDARKGMQVWLDRQTLVQAQKAGPLPSAANPLRSRCAVLVRKMAPGEQAGVDRATHFRRLIDLTNQSITGAMAAQMSGYRLIILQLDPADAARAGEHMNTAMRRHDCGQALELTHEYDRVPGGGGYLQYTLTAYKRPANGAVNAEIARTKIYRTDMGEAFKSLNFSVLAAFFIDDMNAAGFLSEISI